MTKKFLISLLILIFILLPVSSIIACTIPTPTTSTVKTVRYNSASPYINYFNNNIGMFKIIQEEKTQINKSTKYSLPIIKINGVPLSVENIYPGIQTPDIQSAEPQVFLTVPEPTATVSIPEPAPSPQTETGTMQTSLQSEMLGYINAARANYNLAPLVLDDKLCQGALLKSEDMAANNYFSHTSPTYGSPFDMMKNLGIIYSSAGENIAKNNSVKGAHDAFMNSSGHRANILNTSFTKVGLGFYKDGYYLYVTQWFTN